jgi:hypothetical protein
MTNQSLGTCTLSSVPSELKQSTGIDLTAMPYKLRSGRRYLNGELVDPPQLGPWTPQDLDPLDGWDDPWEDLITAGLLDLDYFDDNEWEEIQGWLYSLFRAEVPLLFLIERCCDDVELLPRDMLDTRLQHFPDHWRSACLSAIEEAPQWLGEEIVIVVAWAVRIERARRSAEARAEEPPHPTLTFFQPG